MSEIEYVNLGPDEYDRAKAVLNKAKHPGFVGRELFFRCATSGVCCLAVVDGQDMGVALIAKGRLQALSIIAAAQGKGVGSALMQRLKPEWVQSIAARVSFFEKLGYKAFGPAKIGQNGKHATQLMQRGEMPEGEVKSVSVPTETTRAATEDAAPQLQLADLVAETPRNRLLAKLEILESELAKARANDRHDAVLKILAAIELTLTHLDRPGNC
jgi:GNAT superfamily N-acetyltransferase